MPASSSWQLSAPVKYLFRHYFQKRRSSPWKRVYRAARTQHGASKEQKIGYGVPILLMNLAQKIYIYAQPPIRLIRV